MAELSIRRVSPDQHDPVMHYFDLVAYADNPNWSKCYCTERLVDDYSARTKEQNRQTRSELILSAKANGLVAYRLGRVVGWCHPAPKTELLHVPEPIRADLGAIVCFVVAPDQRRQGIASQLLDAALDHLRGRGMREVEAYPATGEMDVKRWPQVNYRGPLSMYLQGGFTVVAEHEGYCVVRRTL